MAIFRNRKSVLTGAIVFSLIAFLAAATIDISASVVRLAFGTPGFEFSHVYAVTSVVMSVAFAWFLVLARAFKAV